MTISLVSLYSSYDCLMTCDSEWRREVILRFVDICGIVNKNVDKYHCLNLLFIIDLFILHIILN
jgi:hypothetical protein